MEQISEAPGRLYLLLPASRLIIIHTGLDCRINPYLQSLTLQPVTCRSSYMGIWSLTAGWTDSSSLLSVHRAFGTACILLDPNLGSWKAISRTGMRQGFYYIPCAHNESFPRTMFHAHLADLKSSIDVAGSVAEVFTRFYQIAFGLETPSIGHSLMGRKAHIVLLGNDKHEHADERGRSLLGRTLALANVERRAIHYDSPLRIRRLRFS